MTPVPRPVVLVQFRFHWWATTERRKIWKTDAAEGRGQRAEGRGEVATEKRVHHTVHYSTVQYITLHYITLHYITLHYITLLQYTTITINNSKIPYPPSLPPGVVRLHIHPPPSPIPHPPSPIRLIQKNT